MAQKTVVIKCPCGAVHNHRYLPATWPKDKVQRGWDICRKCKKPFEYEIVGAKCSSWYR